MNKLPRIITAFVGLLVFTFLFIVAVLGTSSLPAQTAVAKNSLPPTKGLTLSPLRTELEIEPGRSLDRTLKLINYSGKPMTVHLSAEKFSVINQQYDYAFSAESDTAKWVTFPLDKVTLESGKSMLVPYNIGVPLTAEPGGRYISLFATTDSITGDGGVKSIQRIASLVYLTVTGSVSRTGHIVSLTSPWVASGPDTWSVALQNSGTTHYRSRYSVDIQNLIGNGSVASASGDALILPGTVRLVTGVLPVPSLPGLYRVIYRIGLGDTPAQTETRFLIYMPSWVVVLLILIMSMMALLLPRKRLRKNHSK